MSQSPAQTSDATWDSEALYLKAQRYWQETTQFETDDWQYALWSSLALELLVRASLAHCNPALLADTKNGSSDHLLNALGYPPTTPRYIPKSITVDEALNRLATVDPQFDQEAVAFGKLHTGSRNAELHSGEMPFDGVKPSTWQPKFYRVTRLLLDFMCRTMDDFYGPEEAAIAEQLIAAAADEKARSVQGDIHAAKAAWEQRDQQERGDLKEQARIWSRRQDGHRINCPACDSPGLIKGIPAKAATKTLEEDTIIEKQEFLPSQFECVACGLRISSLSSLAAAGLSDRFTRTTEYGAAEYYAPEDDWPEFEDDNNEPF